MSSIVSRRPPSSGSTSQAKDFFWMSIRFGTSTDLSRRANVRRVREASTEAKTATPRGGRSGAGEVRGACRGHTGATSQDSTGEGGPPGEGRSALTDPARPGSRMWREGRCGRLRLSAEWPQDSDGVKIGKPSRLNRLAASVTPDFGYHIWGMVRLCRTSLIFLQSEHPTPSAHPEAARHRLPACPAGALRHTVIARHSWRERTKGRLGHGALSCLDDTKGAPLGALLGVAARGAWTT